eukprot:gnl/TRDRNA2_/TRDRNA2_181257_c0_seq1.p1 gnl/TRDRNA2_/TRDRNA2_181257_c0~~gnl/TRDRNA2_/TRDRNA2_181257_c0_seq1.p1  ORF type:complete len:363 (+),score=70.25 gnl/TRDRNA2_/TRDRNA2_181257_c0_seq1:103-1191(+)
MGPLKLVLSQMCRHVIVAACAVGTAAAAAPGVGEGLGSLAVHTAWDGSLRVLSHEGPASKPLIRHQQKWQINSSSLLTSDPQAWRAAARLTTLSAWSSFEVPDGSRLIPVMPCRKADCLGKCLTNLKTCFVKQDCVFSVVIIAGMGVLIRLTAMLFFFGPLMDKHMRTNGVKVDGTVRSKRKFVTTVEGRDYVQCSLAIQYEVQGHFIIKDFSVVEETFEGHQEGQKSFSLIYDPEEPRRALPAASLEDDNGKGFKADRRHAGYVFVVLMNIGAVFVPGWCCAWLWSYPLGICCGFWLARTDDPRKQVPQGTMLDSVPNSPSASSEKPAAPQAAESKEGDSDPSPPAAVEKPAESQDAAAAS